MMLGWRTSKEREAVRDSIRRGLGATQTTEVPFTHTEADMIRRYAFWWFTCRDSNKRSGRSWARQLGISHTWLQNIVREFQSNPDEVRRLQAAEGDPKLTDLVDAQECTREMRHRGELRPLR